MNIEKTDTRQVVADQLRRLREYAGMTLDEVGTKIEKSGKTVSAWEKGRGQPDAAIFIKLCDVYHCDISDFFGYEKKQEKTDTTDLSADEIELLQLWRDASPAGRASAMMVLKCNNSELLRRTVNDYRDIV